MKRHYLCGLLFCSSLVVASDQTLQGVASSSLPSLKVVSKFVGHEKHMFEAKDSQGRSYRILCNPEDLSLEFSPSGSPLGWYWQKIASDQINWGKEKQPITPYNITPKSYKRVFMSMNGGIHEIPFLTEVGAPETPSGNESCSASSSTDVRPLAAINTNNGTGLLQNKLIGDDALKQEQLPNSPRGSQSEGKISEEEQAKQALLKKELEQQSKLVQQIVRQHSRAAGVKPFQPGPTWKQVATVTTVGVGVVAGACYLYHRSHTTDKTTKK